MGKDQKRAKSAAVAGKRTGGATGKDAAPKKGGAKSVRLEQPPKPLRGLRGVPPSLTHGTRVRFDIVCARCGKSDTLPFVPKTTGEVLCQACAAEIFGPDWAHGRNVDGRKEWAFTCAKCGRQETVPFEPRPDRELLCRACLRGEEQPDKERLRRMRRVE